VASVEGTAATAMLGTKLSAFRTETVQARVQITTAIDLVGPASAPRVVRINDPRVLDFVRTLRTGDEVDVTYGIGVAASVVLARG